MELNSQQRFLNIDIVVHPRLEIRTLHGRQSRHRSGRESRRHIHGPSFNQSHPDEERQRRQQETVLLGEESRATQEKGIGGEVTGQIQRVGQV